MKLLSNGGKRNALCLPQRKHGPLRPRHLVLWDVVTVTIVLSIAVLGIVMRGWFGAEARIKSDPEENSSYINGGDHNKPVVVVFVHGVFGDKNGSWLNTRIDERVSGTPRD